MHDLFYNTPARRRFLRTERTEFGQIEKWETEIEGEEGGDGSSAEDEEEEDSEEDPEEDEPPVKKKGKSGKGAKAQKNLFSG